MRILLFVVICYAVVCLLAFLFQRKLMYLPSSGAPAYPDGAPGLVEIALEADDGTALAAWYWPGERRGTVVLFHGNAGHRGHRLFWMRRIHAMGYGAFVLDYRGYGGSDGAPSEPGFYLDGDAAIRWVRGNAEGSLVIAGTSIGGGVAIEMARRSEPAGLLLTDTAPSTTDIAKNAYPFLPVEAFLKDRFDSRKKIGEIAAPVLILHGEADRIVPIALGRALFDLATEPKRFVSFPDVGHNDVWDAADGAYWKSVADFLDESLAP